MFASPTLARVSGCCRVPGVDIGQLWSELTLMGRWWQPVATPVTPGQSRDPGDSEQWPGAQTRPLSSILGPSPGAPSVTASVRASEPEMSC